MSHDNIGVAEYPRPTHSMLVNFTNMAPRYELGDTLLLIEAGKPVAGKYYVFHRHHGVVPGNMSGQMVGKLNRVTRSRWHVEVLKLTGHILRLERDAWEPTHRVVGVDFGSRRGETQ